MIRYALRCRAGHEFDSWFRSADAFDALQGARQVTCPTCGSPHVTKALMAPQVSTSRDADPRERAGGSRAGQAFADGRAAPARPAWTGGGDRRSASGPLSAPSSAREAALAELRRRIEAESEYVGLRFAAEARRIHAGEAPERPIHGEARVEEARALIEDGVPVAPLPFLPGRRAN